MRSLAVARRAFSSRVLKTSEDPRNLFSWHHRTVVLEGHAPKISNIAYVAPSATLTGNVEVWDFASVFNEVVVRGDVKLVRIGAYTSIEDGVVITEAFGPLDDTHDGSTIVGHYVTVGANSVLRACTIEPECIIGAGCTLLEGAYMSKRSALGPGSVLAAGQRVPSGQYWAGNPAVYERDLTEEEVERVKPDAEAYQDDAAEVHKEVSEITPYPMDAVWEAERLGYGRIIGYHTDHHCKSTHTKD